MMIVFIVAYGLIWSVIGGFLLRIETDFELNHFGSVDAESRNNCRNLMFAVGVIVGFMGGLLSGINAPVFSLTCLLQALPENLIWILLIPAFLFVICRLFDLGHWLTRRGL